MTYVPSPYQLNPEDATKTQFESLGLNKKLAQKLTKNLDPNGTRDALNSTQFVQFAKQLQKLKGYDLTKPDTVDWKSFTAYVASVCSGREKIKCKKLFEFIKLFGSMTIEKAKEYALGIYNTALKIYNAMSITAFLQYLCKAKTLAATAAMTKLEQSVKLYKFYDQKIRTLYSLCFAEYETEILKHVNNNEILKIKPYHINHVLNMLAELAQLVNKTKIQYTKMIQNKETQMSNLQNELKKEDRKWKNSCQKKMDVSWKAGTALGILGVVGLFLTPVFWPAAIVGGASLLAAGGSAAIYYHNKDQKKHEKSEKSKKLSQKIKDRRKELQLLTKQNVIQNLDALAENIKQFEQQVRQIKKQYEIKKNLKESDDNIALWLAQKNGHDKNSEKLKMYQNILKELGVDNFETFNNLEADFIDEIWNEEIKKKYNYKTKDLFHVKKVIKKYALDQHLITFKVKKLNITN